jgi:hypothetical protein
VIDGFILAVVAAPTAVAVAFLAFWYADSRADANARAAVEAATGEHPALPALPAAPEPGPPVEPTPARSHRPRRVRYVDPPGGAGEHRGRRALPGAAAALVALALAVGVMLLFSACDRPAAPTPPPDSTPACVGVAGQALRCADREPPGGIDG